MAFRKSVISRRDFQNRVEEYIIGATGWYCYPEVATENGYSDHNE